MLLKGRIMSQPQTKPNRTRNDSSQRREVNNKDSGDQHLLPEQEAENAPHRPHRLNREDMDKLPPDAGRSGEGTH
jgi:hypothetical protein